MKTALAWGLAVIVCAHFYGDANATPTPAFLFTTLGDLPGGSFFSIASGISGDGRTVVGSSDSANGPEAFVWRAETGLIPLGDLPGSDFASSARAVSADGSIVAGNGRLGLPDNVVTQRGFRWTAPTGLTDLGSIPPTNGFSNAWGMSRDGRYISGTAQGPSGFEGFVWDAQTGVMTGIGAFEARAVSDDGSIVSTMQILPGTPNSSFVASRWTAETGHVAIGLLRPNDRFSDPRAMTPDGSTIVGWSAPAPDGTPSNQRAFVWNEGKGMTALPSIFPGATNWISEATAVSADGSVIVGFERVPGDDEQFAVIWDETRGAINLQLFLERAGVSLEGYSLLSATGVSSDGRTIAGIAADTAGFREAFIVTIPAPAATITLLPACGLARRRRSVV